MLTYVQMDELFQLCLDMLYILLNNDRTHSKFQIPLNVNENSVYQKSIQSNCAKLIKKRKTVI